MGNFDLLPAELTSDIISRLPAEGVLQCKAVCTNWRSLVRTKSFYKMHLRRSEDSGELGFIALTYHVERKNDSLQYFEYNDENESIKKIRRFNFKPPFDGFTNFFGSSNGLVCLARNYSADAVYICNPITREYILLPEIKSAKIDLKVNAFSYVSCTDEYKFLSIMVENKTKSIQVYIYTLGSGLGWRNLGEFNFESSKNDWGEFVCVNDTFYWMNHHLDMIITFDLAEEKFCEHLSPPLPQNDFSGDVKLRVLDGCLSFIINQVVDRAYCLHGWLLKKENDNYDNKGRDKHQSMGWSAEYRVFYSDEFNFLDGELFAVTKSNHFLAYCDNHINIQYPEASTLQRIVDFQEQFNEVIRHKNTLVSLKELGEKDAKIMESVNIAETETRISLFNQL